MSTPVPTEGPSDIETTSPSIPGPSTGRFDRRSLLRGGLSLGMLSGLSGCVTASSHSSAPTPLSTSGSKPMFPTEADIRTIAGKPTGTVLRRERIPTSLGNATAWKIDYVSKDSHGKPQRVSGLVVAPNSSKANRPVLTWCHGTTGIGDAGCPSALPDPARELSTYFEANSTAQIDYGVPGAQRFLDAGWIVCATDYQGLGSPGMHQYTVNRSNALDGLTLVHAVRNMNLGAGTQVGCMGWSQGGGAAVTMAELEAEDLGDLDLIGVVGMSPGVAKFGLMDPTGVGTALKDPTVPPDSHLVMLLCGHAAANPDLKLSDVFTPLGEEIVLKAWNHQPVHHINDTIGRLFRLRGPILKSKMENFARWEAAIMAGSGGQKRPSAPVLVCVDGFMGGTAVPVPWQRAYIAAAEKMGGSITTRDYPKDDHFSLPGSCIGECFAWLNARI